MDVATVSPWLGTAVLGAVFAVLGYVGTLLVEIFEVLRKEKLARRAKLAELLALIRAGDAAWKVQCENRDSLVQMIRNRDPKLAREVQGYDNLLASAYPKMTSEELALHGIVRAITVHTFYPLNKALLKWLQTDTEFRVRLVDSKPHGKLAKYLADLEAHLLLWEAKYKIWIPEHPERALVYLADEARHGVGFPRNGAALVKAILYSHRR